MDQNLSAQCICPLCPSYVKCQEPNGYCLPEVKASVCIKFKNGCICTSCPVAEQMGYDGEFFCLAGAGD
jgi:hypothetical protein